MLSSDTLLIFMKTLTTIAPIVMLIFIACNNQQDNAPTPETPKALEKNTSDEISISKRMPDDLVESLYKEQIDKTPALKDLEQKIDQLSQGKGDSTASFYKYDEKNQSYYNAASNHLHQVKDSLLRKKLESLIAASLTSYNTKSSRHTSLIATIDPKTSTLNDLHTMLKVVRTLPLMEQYQKDHLPSTQPIENYLRQLDGSIQLTDTLMKK